MALDKNRDDLLSSSELLAGFEKISELQEYLGEDPLMLFDAVNRSGSGTLNLHEFAAATLPPSVMRDERVLWQAFRAFDRNAQGEVTVDEVLEVARLLEGCLLAPQQLEELVAALRLELCGLGVAFERPLENGEKNMWEKFTDAVPAVRRTRRLDFGEFVYLCATRQQDWRIGALLRKEFFRLAERCTDTDLYGVQHKIAVLPWPLENGEGATTPRSVCQQRGGLAADVQRAKRKSKRRVRSKKSMDEDEVDEDD